MIQNPTQQKHEKIREVEVQEPSLEVEDGKVVVRKEYRIVETKNRKLKKTI